MAVPSNSAHQIVQQARRTAILACVMHDNLGRSRKPSYVAMITKASRNEVTAAGCNRRAGSIGCAQRREIGANLELLESLMLWPSASSYVHLL